MNTIRLKVADNVSYKGINQKPTALPLQTYFVVDKVGAQRTLTDHNSSLRTSTIYMAPFEPDYDTSRYVRKPVFGGLQ